MLSTSAADFDSYEKMINDSNKIDTAPALYYGDLNQLSSNQRNYKNASNYSRFGKRMDDMMREINTLTKEIDREYKEAKDRIKKFQSSVNGAKYESELRTLAANLLNQKLASIKAKADLAAKQDKAYKEDIKLSMEVNGGVAPGYADTISNTNTFISSFLTQGGMDAPTYNITPKVSEMTPIKPMTASVVTESTPVDTKLYDNNTPKPIMGEEKVAETVPSPVVEEKEPVIPTPEPEIVEEVIETTPVEEVEEIPVQPTPVIEPEVTDEGLDDFVTDQTGIDYGLSYKHIMASQNPNIKYFFKYNKEDKIGYVIAVDEEKKMELPELDILPMELTYPWTLDHVNKVATVMVQDDYPIMYTEDPTPENIREAYTIVFNRENGLVDTPEEETNEE